MDLARILAIQIIQLIFSVLGGLGGLILVHKFLENTLFRRSYAKRRISRLAPGTTVDFFRDILGPPTFVNDNSKTKQHVFVDDLFYVTAVTDPTDKVLAYSVTTRRKGFTPSRSLGPYTFHGKRAVVRLGKSRFSELDVLGNGTISAGLGARRIYYQEEYYFGNPGSYQTYLFSMNDAGYGMKSIADPQVFKISTTATSDPRIQEFRKRVIINTYMITAPAIRSDDLGGWMGPDLDQVRIL